ncbi:MAG: hypothetical protein HYY20_03025 [Candidatus Tectomicrobia bacterium]|uniref:Uncharacterized protein n=1 Tax=Tectimicrobiota bacterium TaxID=2528274 RepID=A0A932CMJ8_UNCTE|nr:hypothetical protein [Candidatus Tectomicrobia bacterium]
MARRPRYARTVLLGLGLLLTVQAWAPTSWSAVPPVDFWRTLLPLGGPPGSDQAPQAFHRAEQLGGMLHKILLRRSMDPELKATLAIILRRTQDLDLKSLYTHPTLPWREAPAGQKFFTYRGWVDGKDYRLALITRPPALSAPGDMMSKLALSPSGPSSASRRGFLVRFEHDLHTGPLGMEEELAMGEALLGLLDACSQSSLRAGLGDGISPDGTGPQGEGPEDHHLQGLFRGSFPRLATLLGRYLEVADVAQVYVDPRLGEPVTRMSLAIRVRKQPLKQDYPHFFRAYERLVLSSAYTLRVRDGSGRLLGESVRQGGHISIRFLTRRGLLYPANDHWQVADPRGLSLHRAHQRPHTIELSSWVRVLGMKVGVQKISLRSAYREGTSTWSLSQVPELILPWGLRQLFSPFVRPFLEYLRFGEEGRGLTYQWSFRPAGDGYIHQSRLFLPLRDSPLFSFLLKLGKDLGHSFSPEARQELLDLLGEMATAVRQDYQQARVALLSQRGPSVGRVIGNPSEGLRRVSLD